MAAEAIFEPLALGPLTVRNRVLRSSVAGRFDNYDGTGTPVRVNWDLRFARGGVGAIISSNAPIHGRGSIVPGYAHIDSDESIPFWRQLGERVREAGCPYILQIVHAGRERIVPFLEWDKALSSSSKPEPLNGFPCEAMTTQEIAEVVDMFAQAARRAKEAGLDGIEVAGANGMLPTQFLSSAINDRKDAYGGSLENRARFGLEVVRAIREAVGPDFCVGYKISVQEKLNELMPWLPEGNTLEESLQMCRWLEEAGADYLHISAGGGFPHPRNPAGEFPAAQVVKTYDTILSSGKYTFRNYLTFRTPPLASVFGWWWTRPHAKRDIEGINLPDARAVKNVVSIPVVVTGGFQTASVIAGAIERGDCDAVTIARPLVANPDLVRHFEAGLDRAPKPCTYCNKCLFSFIEHPLACYEEARFDSREQMMQAALAVYETAEVGMSFDAIFEPLRFRNLEVKNRIFRSNIAGRLDDYDGGGTQTRINWELKFARGGVGAILSSWTAVDERGKIVPSFAGIENDERIPFWRELGERVHEHDCRYILQLAHAGRQRDVPTLAFGKGLSSTDKPDPLHGFEAERATRADLEAIKQSFAAAARRAREAGLDGVEIHGANGYLFTQFLSSAINDREDEYGGSLENRARLLLETVEAIRGEVGHDFHLQVKLSTTEHANAFLPYLGKGNTIEDSVQVCRWLEAAGADAIHVSSGSTFPHPENPAGEFSLEDMVHSYDVMLSSGKSTFRNYLLFRLWPANRVMQKRWERDPAEVPARSLPDARAVKRAVAIPVIVTGGFQRASLIAGAISRGDCDAVSIARGLVANNDLVELFRAGHDLPPRPCTYCNKCLYNVLEHPVGCYDERRFPSREAMIEQIMSVYTPS